MLLSSSLASATPTPQPGIDTSDLSSNAESVSTFLAAKARTDLAIRARADLGTGFGLVGGTDQFAVRFALSAGNGSTPVMSVSAEGETLGFAPRSMAINDKVGPRVVSVANSTAEPDGAAVVYANAFGDGVDLEYKVALNGVKETIIIANRPQEKGDLTLHGVLFYDTGALTAFADGTEVKSSATTLGEIELRNEDGEATFVLPKGLARDSSVKSPSAGQGMATRAPRWTSLSQRFEMHGDVAYVDVVVPEDFLQDRETTYPVEIDPSIEPTISHYQEFDNEEIVQVTDVEILGEGSLVIRNSTFEWQTDGALTVDSGGSFVFDNSSMFSNDPSYPFDMFVYGEATFTNALITGRSRTTLVIPPSPASLSLDNVTHTGTAGDCLTLGGQLEAVSISHSTFVNCGGSGLIVEGGGSYASGWSVSNTTFANSTYGLQVAGGDWSAATFDNLTAVGNRIAGFTADDAVVILTNCYAFRNARGWAAVSDGTLMTDTCVAEGNAIASFAFDSTTPLLYDTITNSSVLDVACFGDSTCDPTGGNYAEWVTLSDNSEMTFRHVLDLTVVDASAVPLSNYPVYVADRYGNAAANLSLTDDDGHVRLTVSDRRIWPDSDITFYTPHTLHLGASPTYNVTTVIDSDWRRTVYATGDADNDSLADGGEGDGNAWWFDAANHVFDGAQLRDGSALLRTAVARAENGSFVRPDTFPELDGGAYQVAFEAWTNRSDAALTLRVENQEEDELLPDIAFSLNASVGWYMSSAFDLDAGERPSLLLVDEGAMPVGSILVSKVMFMRVRDGIGENTTGRPGAASDPLESDTDGDGANDGLERRNGSLWQEAELAGDPSAVRELDRKASSGAAMEHGNGERTIVEAAFDGLTPGAEYALWVRAVANVGAGSSLVELTLVDSSTETTETPAAGSAYRWLAGPTVTIDGGGVLLVRIRDIADDNPSSGANFIRVDSFALVNLDAVGEFARASSPLERDTDFDGVDDGPELWGFFTADFVNASDGDRCECTALIGEAAVFASSSDWVNVSVPIRYDGWYRFHIEPQILVPDGEVEIRQQWTRDLLKATLSDGANNDIAHEVNFSTVYMGSSAPPMQGSYTELEGWYSYVYANLTAGTYHLRVVIDEAAAAVLAQFSLLLARIYIEKRSLDTLDEDGENDGVLDGDELRARSFPLNADSDYDHLPDLEELTEGEDDHFTNPLDRDTDHDGLWDAVEVGGYGDTDNGTTTNPTNPDTDGDGVPDGWIDDWSYGRDFVGLEAGIGMKDGLKQPWEGEDLDLGGAVDGGEFDVDREDAAQSVGGETDPNDPDSDGDGMPDGWELWVRAFNESEVDSGNDPLILDPLLNDSEGDDDVDRNYFEADADGLTNYQEYLAGTDPHFADTEQDYARDGEEAKVELRTIVREGFRNSTNFSMSDEDTWIYYDANPYDEAAGMGYWYVETENDPEENFPGSLFFGAELLRTIEDGGAILYNQELDLIYVWEAGSQYAYTGTDAFHNGTVHVFANGTLDGVTTAEYTQRGFDGQEFLGRVDPTARDSDGDMILDGWDGPRVDDENLWGEDPDDDGLVNALDNDSDGDGVPDGAEFSMGGESFMPELGATNPYQPDTDGDGTDDAEDATPLDFDNDEMTGFGAFDDGWGSWEAFDGTEAAYFNAQLNRSLAWDNPDSDGDGVTDGVEDANRNGEWDESETNALDVDTDDDGLWDGPDVYHGVTTVLEAENASSHSSGVAEQSGFGASGGASLNWTGYLESASWSLDVDEGYYRLDLALADDAAPSNTTSGRPGKNLTVEVILDGVLLNISAISVNASVHLPDVHCASVSPIPIWNGSAHLLTLTFLRADEDWRFHIDYLRILPFHPGEWNASAKPLDADSDGDGLMDGAERGLVAPLTHANNTTALGTNLALFFPLPHLAIAWAGSNDTDRDGVLDGYSRLANVTTLEAEMAPFRHNTQNYTGGPIGVTTLTGSGGGDGSWSAIGFSLVLEPGYYEVVGNVTSVGCQPAPCPPANYRAILALGNVTVGGANFTVPEGGPWVEALMGAFFIPGRGTYRLEVREVYGVAGHARFTVDRLFVNRYDIGEFSLGTNPSAPDTDRDLIGDAAEVLVYLDNPTALDTDNDGLPDAAEAPFLGDYDGDANRSLVNGWVNYTDASDVDRDNDSAPDGAWNESSVVFRTNATRGMYNETGVWVAVDVNDTQTLTVYRWDACVAINFSNVSAVTFRTYFGNNTTREATTPEGFALYKNGSWVFIDMPGMADVRLLAVSSAYAPENATSTTPNPFYTLALREALNWSRMLEGDIDGDGLLDSMDPCPTLFDCDGDEVGDGEEVIKQTDPLNVDSDGDGLWDGPTRNVSGVTHVGERATHTKPTMNDTDGDGLWDGWNITVGGSFHLGEANYSTDPTTWDTDSDGMPDLWELDHGFNPLNSTDAGLDLDKDGLANVNEYAYGKPPGCVAYNLERAALSSPSGGGSETECLEWEESFGTWPDGTNVSHWDTDGDGMPDGWEYDFGLDPLNVSDASTDYDEDSLNASTEYRLGKPPSWAEAVNGTHWNGSDPTTSDTDADGCFDAFEYNGNITDPDGDGIANWRDIDSDHDNLTDAIECGGWFVSIIADEGWWNFTKLNRTQLEFRTVTSDPYSDEDVDTDALGDLAEYENRTDPNLRDSDHDGRIDLTDPNNQIPELVRPQLGALINVSWNVDCGGDGVCERMKSQDGATAFLAKAFAWLTNPGSAMVMVAKWTWVVTVYVNALDDNGGLSQIRVDAVQLNRSVSAGFRTGPRVYSWAEGFTFRLTAGEALTAGAHQTWQVLLIDNNGNAFMDSVHTGLLWDATRNELSMWLKPWVESDNGFNVGVFEGAKVALFMAGVGMGWGPVNFVEWTYGTDGRGEAGASIVGMFEMIGEMGSDPAGVFHDLLVGAAMSEGMDLNPYSMDVNDTAALLMAYLTDNMTIFLDHLMNASADALCESGGTSSLFGTDAICATPHNTSKWAKFLAGYSLYFASVQWALQVIMIVGMVDMIAGGLARLARMIRPAAAMEGPGGLDANLRTTNVVRELIPRYEGSSLVGTGEVAFAEAVEIRLVVDRVTGRSFEPGVFDAFRNTAFEGDAIRAARVITERGDPLGIFEGDGVNVPLRLAEGKGPLLDAVVKESGRFTDSQFGAALEATRGCPELWIEGRLSNFLPDQIPAAAKLYLDMRAFGVPKGGTIVVIGESMKLRVNPFTATLRELGFETRTFETTLPPAEWMEANRQWIRDRIANGETVVDIGPQYGRTNYPGPTSPFYTMELNELKGYGGYKDYGGWWK